MSYDHTTCCFEAFDAAIRTLRFLSIYPKVEHLDKQVDVGFGDKVALRKATFRIPWNGEVKVVEEYLAVQDCDCDGTDLVEVAVYDEGKRPDLESLLKVIPA